MPAAKGGYVYIMSNKLRTVLYIGMSADLVSRAYDHKNGHGCDFTKKYKCFDLVFYEFFETIDEAIEREKQLKKWRRMWKEDLIKKANPQLRDLYDNIDGFN